MADNFSSHEHTNEDEIDWKMIKLFNFMTLDCLNNEAKMDLSGIRYPPRSRIRLKTKLVVDNNGHLKNVNASTLFV